MTATLPILRTITVALYIFANMVASTPSCHDCVRLNANEADSCNDFDPVVCCGDTDPNAYQCIEKNTDNVEYPCNSDFCELDLPNATASLLAPYDGLEYKLFDYNKGNNYKYDLYLRWQEPLNTSMLDCYKVAIRFINNGETSKVCRTDLYNDVQRTIDPDTREFVRELSYPSGTQDVFVQVAAVPLFVWKLSFKVKSSSNCIQGCLRCECKPPPPPTNLNWSRLDDDPSSIILSWAAQGHSSESIYYLHLNSSVNGKLLYRVEGTTWVTVTNLIGEVTVWLESYDCGCSENTSEKISFTIDGPSTTILPSQTSSVVTSMISISSPIAVSSTIDVPPSVTMAVATPSNVTTATPIVAIIASVSVAVALSIVVLLLVVMVALYRLQHVRSDKLEPKEMAFTDTRTYDRSYESRTDDRSYESRNGSLETNFPVHRTETGPYVILIFSQDTPKTDQDIIRSYGLKLNKMVAVKMYDAADRSTRAAWLEQNYEQASAILCVCNKAFVMEWNNANSFAGGSIVSAVKMIVQGQIEHQTVPEKFAALFLNKEDRKLTPPYLKNVRSFELCPENMEPISRFALSVKEYI